jgi:hypothetical protein
VAPDSLSVPSGSVVILANGIVHPGDPNIREIRGMYLHYRLLDDFRIV